MMARPLGAFIHFLKEPPRTSRCQHRSLLLLKTVFRLVADDPLEALKDLRKDVYAGVFPQRLRLLSQPERYRFAEPSHNSHDRKAHGGRALPLESYLPEVWKAFIFDQNRIAKKSAHRRIRWRIRAGICSLIWLTGCARHAAKRINLRSLGDRQS
jgi:hypothetical protein